MKLLGVVKGNEIYSYTLETEKASAEILNYGAILYSFSIKMKGGEVRNIVASAADIEEQVTSSAFAGQVVAPNANRIKEGKFTLNGVEYQAEANNGPNNLHSGSANIGFKVWSVVEKTENSILLETCHKHKTGGFPGNMKFRVKYTLTGSTLNLDYEVETDQAALCNITNHAYFNLDGKSSTILNHEIKTSCDYYLAVDDTLIPRAKVAVENTDFDFRNKTRIGDRREGKYDHFFVFGNEKYLELYTSDLKLNVKSDQAGLQIYSGVVTKFDNPTLPGVSEFSQAVALETSGYPNAINNDSYPSVVINKGEVYKTNTSYEIVEL